MTRRGALGCWPGAWTPERVAVLYPGRRRLRLCRDRRPARTAAFPSTPTSSFRAAVPRAGPVSGCAALRAGGGRMAEPRRARPGSRAAMSPLTFEEGCELENYAFTAAASTGRAGLRSLHPWSRRTARTLRGAARAAPDGAAAADAGRDWSQARDAAASHDGGLRPLAGRARLRRACSARKTAPAGKRTG